MPPTAPARAAGPAGERDPAAEVWRAPLVPAALAVTLGIVLDRYLCVPLAASLIAAAGCLAAWLAAAVGLRRGLALVYLALAGAAFGAAWHHYCRDVYPADDIGGLAPADPRPARLRGVLAAEPARQPALIGEPLRSRDRPVSASAVLIVTSLRQYAEWVPVSGRVRLVAEGTLEGLHAGDPVEAVGRLEQLRGPANPGEFDAAAFWRDRGVRAQLVARPGDGVVRLERGWTRSPSGWLAVVRGWGQDVLTRELPPATGGLAAALLLGEGAPLDAAEWDRFLRTGVLHVLAISGQHLVILAAVLWAVLRLAGVRQRYGAAVVAGLLFAYALLTGGRPPALRAAVMVAALCAGLVLRRRSPSANAYALAWLVVVLIDPAAVFSTGCQLSFLAVAVLHWGAARLFAEPTDPLERLIEESRPAWLRALRWTGRQVLAAYAAGALIWLAVTPLAASRYHLVSPVGILLGPPLTLLTALALVGGFLLLASAALAPPLTALFAVPVHLAVRGCERLVDVGAALPGAYFYVGDVPKWWLAAFYLGLFAVLTWPERRRRRWGAAAGLGWLCIGLAGAAARLPSDELRVTFLAVGHGGCTVLETPDGRTLLYDAGAISGPEVAKRQVAPFLWWRGVRRIDEVFLSHADLDHFNGLPDLLDRFAVGRVTCTPTFADKSSRAVAHTLDVLERRGVPVHVVKAGDVLAAGPVTLEVLHPPADGPAGNENSRSLVLLVCHAGHTLLLTGDLEGPGLDRVLALPRRRADILMAPHHGSRRANPPDLAAWCRPRAVVSCQGPPPGWRQGPEPYSAAGARYLGTWPHGAVTVRSHASGLVVETFVTGERFVIASERH